ncbi:MAG: undecaprenyl-phosphate glucose phosphotransferase [Cyanobacteria bacterium J06642_2]
MGLLRGNAVVITMLQRLLDPLLIVGLLYGVCIIRRVPFFNGPQYVLLSIITFLLVLPVFKAMGLYRSFRGEPLAGEIPRILLGWMIVIGIILMCGYATRTSHMFPRSIVLPWVLSVPPLLVASYLSVRLWLRYLRSRGFNTRNAVIAGAGLLGRRLSKQILSSPYLGIELEGFFDDRKPRQFQQTLPAPLLGSLNELADYARTHLVDSIYITLPMQSEGRVIKLIDDLRDTTASVYFVPDIFIFNLIHSGVQEVNGIPMLGIWETPFYGLRGAVKRASDIIIAGIVLTLIAPIMAAISVGVKLSSPGPILFKQRRYGLNGQEIVVYKFRSMTVAEDGDKVVQATRDDKRITPFGGFLRRTSLDELPQFINVLQGRMSIVGPRPHAVAHNEEYRKLISGYMQRHKVKPGITGLAQINGLRGETDTLDKMERRVRYDLYYVKKWSLWLDLQIIFKTVFTVLKDENAY